MSSYEALALEFCWTVAAVKRLVDVYGMRRARAIMSALRSPGRWHFLRVNTLKASREEVLSELREEGLNAEPYDELPDAVRIPVQGPYKVEVRGRKPVYVDKAAAEAVYMGADLYAPGVLRAEGVKAGDEVVILSPKGHVVAAGVAVMDGEEMEARGRGLAVKVTESVYKVPSVRSLDLYERGLIYDQSLPSILSVHVLSPKPGWRVLDMCAAPGGKATHAAQLMRNDGEVVAVDRSPRRLERLRENVARLGTSIVKPVLADSRYLDLMGFGDFDAVILDPPCSAMGVRPKLYYERGEGDFKSLSNYQRQFLRVAAKVVRPGGLVLYTTCTLTLEENEVNIAWAVEKLGLRLVKQRYLLGSRGFKVGGVEASCVQRFEPDVHDAPGFFIALLKRPKA